MPSMDILLVLVDLLYLLGKLKGALHSNRSNELQGTRLRRVTRVARTATFVSPLQLAGGAAPRPRKSH